MEFIGACVLATRSTIAPGNKADNYLLPDSLTRLEAWTPRGLPFSLINSMQTPWNSATRRALRLTVVGPAMALMRQNVQGHFSRQPVSRWVQRQVMTWPDADPALVPAPGPGGSPYGCWPPLHHPGLSPGDFPGPGSGDDRPRAQKRRDSQLWLPHASMAIA